MRKTDLSVQELVDMITRGELRLPEMQRQYVWRATRVRDLLDSLYRGYPSGTILVWETDQKMPTRDVAVKQEVSAFDGHKLLLDGQQRLTSLSAVLRGEPIKVRGRTKPIEILFNLEHPDQLTQVIEVNEDADDEEDESVDPKERLRGMTFMVSNRATAAIPTWVSVTDVLKSSSNTPFLKRTGATDIDDPRHEKYTQRLDRLRAIRKYPFTMQVLERSLSYEEVTEIFVRVNSLGAKLRSSDLALAQITATWPNSLKLFEGFADELEKKKFELPVGVLVRTLVVFATGQSRFETVGKLSVEKLDRAWKEAQESLRFAVDFLRNNAGIESPALVTSPLFVIAIAYFAHLRKYKLGKDVERQLLYWLHVGNGKGVYSASTETKLDQDLATIRQSGDPAQMLATLRSRVGRMDFEPGDFVGKTQVSPLFRLMFLALKDRGAKDWHNGLAISVSFHKGKHSLQFHHIHPKATLRGEYSKQMVNEIANFAFICGSTNRRLGKRPPAKYLPAIIEERGKAAVTSQCIPMKEELLQTSGFEKFLEARRKLLSDAVNEFVDQFREE